MKSRILLPLILLAIVATQVKLHVAVIRISTQDQGRAMELTRYNYQRPEGVWMHFIQSGDEELPEFGQRVGAAIKSGEYTDGGIKSETWTDSEGGTHQVTLAHDPAWSVQEWCRRFDRAVEIFQELFPCE